MGFYKFLNFLMHERIMTNRPWIDNSPYTFKIQGSGGVQGL
jgi:hypothetical protein